MINKTLFRYRDDISNNWNCGLICSGPGLKRCMNIHNIIIVVGWVPVSLPKSGGITFWFDGFALRQFVIVYIFLIIVVLFFVYFMVMNCAAICI